MSGRFPRRICASIGLAFFLATGSAARAQAPDPDSYRRQRAQEMSDSEVVVPQRAADDREISRASAEDRDSALRDAWLDGKLEASFALNPHLSAFAIDTEVEHGRVRLTGQVDSELDRDLATEVAKNVEGVTDVRNDLIVQPGSRAADESR